MSDIVEVILDTGSSTVVEVVERGLQGLPGANGPAGPNAISSATDVSFSGTGLLGHAAGKATSPSASDIRTLLGIATDSDVAFRSVNTTRWVTVGTDATGAVAGSIYRNANTLRYRDSANTERRLLNNLDNLSGLDNVATARTNLGLGTTDSPTFAGLVVSGNARFNAIVNDAALQAITFRSGVVSQPTIINGLDAQSRGTNQAAFRAFAGATTNAIVVSTSSVDAANFTVSGDGAVTLGASGVLRGGVNLIEQRNGTAGQIYRLYKTFTSTTNFETLEFDAASDAANYRIGSRIGSGGGTTRGLHFGAYDGAGTWTTRLAIGNAGGITSSEVFALSLVQVSGASGLGFMSITPATTSASASDRPWLMYTAGGPLLRTRDMVNARDHVQLSAGATSASASASFFCNLIGDAAIRWRPASTESLSVNGQFTIELTSNTAGNLVYRGSDGVTRRMPLTFI